ncbi:ferritin-like domain-containing protein [Croceivirga sp. JEA036]|uniref:ferritin-like domain-containing protein n=1 Tax=Croceivirga sp. JEA036 TaxID=2721162 RepID=UPI00143A1ACC|nr:PA2169 family four-helix-bundle protein [Croceivirga sp. JEA036]NJB35664.1 PA2169 family four-helix-bundle protein [Croceivirga sp. JEA036]
MSLFEKTTEDKLNNLLAKAYDAEQGFTKAAEKIDNPTLQRFFEHKANERNQFKAELEHELVAKGMDINKSGGSVLGAMHRAWIDTKALFSQDDEEAMLEEVRNGEKAALEDYQEVLKETKIPTSTLNILTAQKNKIEQSYNRANYLEEIH